MLCLIINLFIIVTSLARVIPYVDQNKVEVPGIVSFQSGNKRFIRCEFCRKYPHIIKQHNPKKVPAITTMNGTRFYSRVLTEHLDSLYHKECSKSYRVRSMEVEESAPMEIAINKANKKQIDRVGQLMIQVYLDAKLLNLSAYTWPPRYVAGVASFSYDSLNQNKSILTDDIDLQYVNGHGHLNLMTTIVKSHREDFLRKINDCSALSLRVDGSIDFTHTDKIYVMAKLINMNGTSELVFVEIAEQTERYARGLFNAVKEAMKVMIDDPSVLFRKISSVCTDGTNLNSGEKNGLWIQIENEMKAAGSTIPLTKVWCAAHRAELAWKNSAKSVAEVSKILGVLSKMSTYFHFSAIRSAELQSIAARHNLRLLMLPKIFEIR